MTRKFLAVLTVVLMGLVFVTSGYCYDSNKNHKAHASNTQLPPAIYSGPIFEGVSIPANSSTAWSGAIDVSKCGTAHTFYISLANATHGTGQNITMSYQYSPGQDSNNAVMWITPHYANEPKGIFYDSDGGGFSAGEGSNGSNTAWVAATASNGIGPTLNPTLTYASTETISQTKLLRFKLNNTGTACVGSVWGLCEGRNSD